MPVTRTRISSFERGYKENLNGTFGHLLNVLLTIPKNNQMPCVGDIFQLIFHSTVYDLFQIDLFSLDLRNIYV